MDGAFAPPSTMSSFCIRNLLSRIFSNSPENYSIACIHILPFDLSALKAAITLSLAKDIAVYDSYFAVIADAIGAVYITADEKACNKLEGLTYVKSLANQG